MCGIIGYIGGKDARDILIDGLKKLEYRGYDSAGVALVHDGELRLRRSVGKLINLESSLAEVPIDGTLGIGHTRWATHGRPTEQNAHPHVVDGIAIVHNGIIENHTDLRDELAKKGCVFSSDTDTEIVAHLIRLAHDRGLNLFDSVKEALTHVEGVYALLVVSRHEPDRMIVARKASPLIVALGDGENFVASDVPAILNHANKIVYLEDDDIAIVKRDGVRVFHGDAEVERPSRVIAWNPVAAEKEGHKHFMHKEIFEQPQAIISSLEGRFTLPEGNVYFDGGGLEAINAADVQRVTLLACGTAWHAAQIGRFFIETLAGIPCEVDLGSEYRYRDPIVQNGALCVVVSQSGETADTLASLREAKSRGARSIAVCNVQESSIARTADAVCYTHAGPEIGVASTKAFTTQLAVLMLVAIWLGRRNGFLSEKDAATHLSELARMPVRMQQILAGEEKIREIARTARNAKGYLYLGRHVQHYIALEGALKLKEISYLHAEGYAAGEMKHGPIALIDEEMLVVAIAPKAPTYEKMLSNVEETKARGGRVLSIVTKGDTAVARRSDHVIEIPTCPAIVSPLLTVLPLQLLAYHIADLQGTDVDQPRNLAKSVTVE